MLRETSTVTAMLMSTANRVIDSITPVNWLASLLASWLFAMIRASS